MLQDICYILTMNSKYSKVELLLSCDLLKRLYPVLLLKTLNDCSQEEVNFLENCDNGISICESIKFLLEKSYPDLRKDYDLNKLHVLLKNHIRIVEYVLVWKRRRFINTRSDTKESKSLQSDAIEQTVSVTQILSLLRKHSVLSVLKMTTNIHDQDHSAIHDLLEESGESSENLLFRAYCSVVSALKAILLCEFYSTEHERITEYFADMTSYLSSLFSLPLRIETMENIFSLLFLRYEDFNVTNANPKDDNCENVSCKRKDTSGSVEYERTGFISNKYAVRETLHYLWESVSATTREIDRPPELIGERNAMQEQQLREDTSALTSALMDARWRLKFYEKPHFVENVGVPTEDEPYRESSVASCKSELALSRKPNLAHRVKNDVFFYKGEFSTSENETRIKSDSSSGSDLLGGNPRRRKRSRNTAVAADPPQTSKDRQSPINLMLASRESLVLHSLWRSDLQKAREVIEVIIYR